MGSGPFIRGVVVPLRRNFNALRRGGGRALEAWDEEESRAGGPVVKMCSEVERSGWRDVPAWSSVGRSRGVEEAAKGATTERCQNVKQPECGTYVSRIVRRASLSGRSDQVDRRMELGNPGSRGASTPGRARDAESRATRIDRRPTSISAQVVVFIRPGSRIWQADPTLVRILCALAADLLLTGQIHRFYASPEIAPGRCPSASTLGPKALASAQHDLRLPGCDFRVEVSGVSAHGSTWTLARLGPEFPDTMKQNSKGERQ